MPYFRYQGLNANQQPVAGEREADTVQQAIAQLEAAGLTVQSIGYATSESTSTFIPPIGASAGSTGDGVEQRRVGSVELAALRSHMATVLQQARVITPALRAYADEMPSGRRRRQLRTVCRVLDGGDVAEATSALETLPEYWIPLLSAATSSRDPGRVLQEFLAESHRADELRRQRWIILAYPAIVVCFAAAVLTAISLFVIPIFAEMFSDFGLELPGLTLAVLAVSHWIKEGGAMIVAAVFTVLGLLLLISRRWLASTVEARFAMPFGRSNSIARFAQFTADLLEAGLSIPNALRVAGFTTRKPRVRRAAWHLAGDLERGDPPVVAGLLTEPPADRRSPACVWGQETRAQQRPLTATVLRALRADMAAPSRIRLLREISECYAGRARTRLSWTYGIIEPVSICVVALLVGTIVLALFLPLVMLVEGLSG
jgi:type II secretory pathway component PulF